MNESRTKYGRPLEEKDGHLCIGIPKTNEKGAADDALGTNWIRYYDLPAPDDLGAHLKLLKSLELRFKTHVARGSEIKASRVEELKAVLVAAQESHAPPDVLDTISGDIAIALQKRSFNMAEKYFERRIKEGKPHEDPEMTALMKQSEDVYLEAFGYAGQGFRNIRREDGSRDKDGAIGEMITEGVHILNGVRPEARQALEGIFHRNRFHKASKAWDEIDRVAEAAKQVVADNPVLAAAVFKISDELTIPLPQMLDDLQTRAKQRTHMMRSDPEFYAADVALRATQTALMGFKLPDLREVKSTDIVGSGKFTGQMVGAEKNNTEEAYYLMRSAVRLVYDMAEIRHGRHTSAKEYVAEVNIHLGKDKQKDAAHPPAGGGGWYLD
jgi:hypothetical protein